MSTRPIHPSEIKVGQPLPEDAYDARGSLMLNKGYVLKNDYQVDRLLRNGRFVEQRADVLAKPSDQGSPLAMIMTARHRLNDLLRDAPSPHFCEQLLATVGTIRRACRSNPDVALASILLQREGPYAIRHSINVALACYLVGGALRLPAPELTSLLAAALTMNIGIVDMQQRLQSQETPLTEEQRQRVRQHCALGVAMLRERGVVDPLWLQTVLDHHERPDGSGYPSGKQGEAIGQPARLLGLADIYCARVSGRDYRPPMQPNIALRWIFLKEGQSVDEHLSAVFIKTLGIYPPGTGVRLRNGSVAIVTHRSADGTSPQVSSITTQDGLRMAVPIRRRRDMPAYAVVEVVDLESLQINVGMEALWGADAAW